MRILEYGSITDFDNILSVVTKEEHDNGISSKPQQNGGARCYFDGVPQEFDIKGYWKPCRNFDIDKNSEDFTSEIISFHIDQILGFHRTPAVVPHVFSYQQIDKLTDVVMVSIL